MVVKPSHRTDDLLEQIKEGNQLAFSQLHNDQELPLFYFTNKLVQNYFESKRIVSDTFMKLWELRNNFDTMNSVSAFLYVTCRNAAYDFLRHQNTQKARREVSTDDIEQSYDEGDDQTILHQIIKTEVLSELHKAIDTLPPIRKSVMRLLYIDGRSTEDVAKELNISAQNVRATKFQALQQLRNLVVEHKLLSIALIFSML